MIFGLITRYWLFSFDARGVEVSKGIHMAVSDLEKRCSFSLTGLSGGHLKVFKVTKSDEGLYKCRVDFSNSPTQQYKINLALAGSYMLNYVCEHLQKSLSPLFSFSLQKAIKSMICAAEVAIVRRVPIFGSLLQ